VIQALDDGVFKKKGLVLTRNQINFFHTKGNWPKGTISYDIIVFIKEAERMPIILATWETTIRRIVV
jgi:hypothetical protein